MSIRYSVNDGEMGSEIVSRGAVSAKLHVSCPQALDRIEWLRNGRVLHTHCHQDERCPDDAFSGRCRFEVELGWGPTPSYGLGDGQRDWRGTVSIDSGSLSIVQGCWTDFGNRLVQIDDHTVRFEVRTRSVERARSALLPQNYRTRPTQPFVLEIEADRAAILSIDTDPFDVTFNLGTALARTLLWADLEGSQRAFADRYGLMPHEIENPDVFYHNAFKLRVLQAVPAHQFEAEVEFVDPDPPAGTNAYHARVSQVNGQMAWTSPVWVTRAT